MQQAQLDFDFRTRRHALLHARLATAIAAEEKLTGEPMRVSHKDLKLLLYTLEEHGRGKECFASQETLCEELEIPLRTLQRLLYALDRLGLVARSTRQGGHGRAYKIVWANLLALAPPATSGASDVVQPPATSGASLKTKPPATSGASLPTKPPATFAKPPATSDEPPATGCAPPATSGGSIEEHLKAKEEPKNKPASAGSGEASSPPPASAGSGEASSPPTTPGDVVMVFPVVGGKAKTWALSRTQLEKFREWYPGINVEQECKRAVAWTETNTRKRKTPSGMLKFLNNWLSKAQDDAGRPSYGGKDYSRDLPPSRVKDYTP